MEPAAGGDIGVSAAGIVFSQTVVGCMKIVLPPETEDRPGKAGIDADTLTLLDLRY